VVDAAAMSLAELADHIEQAHHAYLHSELPRLDAMTQRVAAVHGGEDSRLHQVRETFVDLAEEMSSHMITQMAWVPLTGDHSVGKWKFHPPGTEPTQAGSPFR
jgi:iron-sulfur cluster repair protein YtfE (RIC family)